MVGIEGAAAGGALWGGGGESISDGIDPGSPRSIMGMEGAAGFGAGAGALIGAAGFFL